MGVYRISRNIEASIIEYIIAQLAAASWSNVNVEKTFSRIYGIQMDENKQTAAICVRCSDTNRKRVEIGDDAVVRSELVLIDVFATSDGQRLDLVDFLGDILKVGCPYFEHTVTNGVMGTPTQNGRIRFLNIEDKPVNFGVDKSALDIQDRYRHLLSATVSLGKVEI